MTTQTAGTSVRVSVLVEAPIAHAFKVFTEQMGTWWPPDHHILEGELVGMVFEPRVGGYIYDRGANGTEFTLVAGACLRSAEPRRVQLGRQLAVAARDRPGQDQ